jgi:hypothetical protein
MALALDRKSFIQILAEGHGDIGGAMQPPPQGVWGMPAEESRYLRNKAVRYPDTVPMSGLAASESRLPEMR